MTGRAPPPPPARRLCFVQDAYPSGSGRRIELRQSLSTASSGRIRQSNSTTARHHPSCASANSSEGGFADHPGGGQRNPSALPVPHITDRRTRVYILSWSPSFPCVRVCELQALPMMRAESEKEDKCERERPRKRFLMFHPCALESGDRPTLTFLFSRRSTRHGDLSGVPKREREGDCRVPHYRCISSSRSPLQALAGCLSFKQRSTCAGSSSGSFAS